MNIHEYPDREFLHLGLADRIAGQLADFLRREGKASLSVSGGNSPGPVFDILSGVDLDWRNVAVLPNDERWVPEDHPRSNAGLIRARLLRGAASGARLVPLWAPGGQPEDHLAGLAAGVEAVLPLSVALLGMGEDMHTASLFPDGDRLAEALAPDAPAVLAMRAPAAGEPRVTLAARVLAGAMHVHLLITGAAKRAALERAAGLSPSVAPVRAILDHATVHWAE